MMLGFWIFLLRSSQTTFAADKSGVSPNSISVPKGPGSIEGLGESFQPSLNTGTAKYGLGLKLPPGVAGHQPGLGLRYEGGGGNGPLGFGWSLSLPCIQRRTDKGIPTYGADVGFVRSDVFINEMKEELVPQADGYFFCENEGAFIRYRQVADHWEGTLPNGTKLEFGIAAAGRIEDAATSRMFCWLLERETDTRGNVIEYVYRSFTGGQNLNQKYLALVRYGPGAPPWTHFHFVAFAYEDRSDWFEDGRAGFLVRTGKRLKSIRVGSQGVALDGHLAGDFDGDGTTDYLNRRYDLAYLRYAGTNSHWSLLEKVTLVGADGVTSLPPAAFSYAVSNPPDELSAQGHIWGAIDEPFAAMDNELVDLVDLNADGLPDVLKTDPGGGAHTVAVNRGPIRQDGGWAIQWAAAVAVDPGTGTAWNFDLASDRTHLADMDGDGLADLVHKSADDAVFFFANRGKLAWGTRQDMALQESAPPAPFEAGDVRTADVDFDKRIDIIQSLEVGNGIAYRVWFNLGSQTYSSPITVESSGGFAFPVAGVQIADGNGDRVPDIARIQPGAVVVAAGLGYGRFAEPLSLALPDFTLDDLQIAKAKLTDINGDGLADLVIERASPGTCWYWLNLGNYTFSSRKMIVDLPAVFSVNAAVRWADLNGNGTVDLVYSDSQAVPRIQMVEVGDILGGGLMPNLLTQIENGIGALTQIEYAPSTKFALEDAAAGRPWPDALPFPVTVVAAVTVSDSLGHEYATRFRYHDGFYDPVEKQFRGFARAEQVNVGDPTAPTLIGRSSFDTGREFDAMKGRLLRASVETEDGRVFSEETTTWANPPRTLMVGTNGLAVRYAHPVASLKQILELGQGAPQRLESESDYDNYGNQTRVANYGIVENSDRMAFDDERIAITEYALNLEAWIIRLPTRQAVQDENGAVISRSEMFYDDETFSGNNFGSVTIGNLTLRRDWINPSNATAYVQSARTKYDAYGNSIAAFDPLYGVPPSGGPDQGHFRETAYDSRFHAYGIRETIHVGSGKPALVFQATYDEGLATMLSSTDFNSNTTTYACDALARLTSVVKPYDTTAFPTAEYDYAPAVPSGNGIVNFVESRKLDRTPGTAGSKRDHYLISRQFSDGLGRALMTRSEAEPAPGQTTPRVVVSGAVLYNGRQKPMRALNPLFTLQTGSLDQLLAFENIEAPGWQGQFHGNGSLVSLNLAAAHQTSTEYDATLRVVRKTNPDATEGRVKYEPLITKAFDETDTDPSSPHFNTPMVQFTDGLGRLIRVDEIVRLNDDGTPSANIRSWTTHYRYDLNDRLTQVTDSQNNVKLLRYDGLKRKTFMNDPDCGISTNIYDEASNVIETVDAKNQRITYTYDGANRILTEDYHDENSPEFSYHRSPDVAYHYDQPAASVEQGNGSRATARNTRGTLTYVEDSSGEEHTSFDARGRVEWTVKRISDPLLQNSNTPAPLISFRTAFDYDALDRITKVTFPDNDQVSHNYNARGLLERIVGGPTGDVIPSISYLPSAQQAQCDYGNGVRTTYAYDLRSRLTRLSTLNPQLSTELIHFAYDFDAVSNIRAIHDQRPTSAVALADKRRNSQTFTYDDLYRLTRVRYNPVNPQPSTNVINYRYDRIGNMLAQTSDIAHLEKRFSVTDLGTMAYGGAAGRSNRLGRQTNDPPGPHALTSITQLSTNNSQLRAYAYDANGNMANIDGLACTWDFLNRLVAVEDDSMRAKYAYDYTGRRITKHVIPKQPTTDNEPLTTLYIGQHFEVRDYDQPTKYVFNGSTRVARITGSLSANTRIQRFGLRTGWNLLSLAVSATDLSDQLQGHNVVTSVYSWNPQTGNYLPLVPGVVPAGTILWINATTNATIGVIGTYSDPVNRQVEAGATYIASTGLEAWSPTFPSTMAVWSYIRHSSCVIGHSTDPWHARLTGALASVNELPRTFPPGQALYVIADGPSELESPDSALRIRYYHQDHLGSSGVMTDANGVLVEETAFYPFGMARHEHSLHSSEEHYKFTQKERDHESGLHYFEARYLSAGLARFAILDPKYAHPDVLEEADAAAFLSNPQEMNMYAYAHNNPLNYVDPTGLGVAGVFMGIFAGPVGEAAVDEAEKAGVDANKVVAQTTLNVSAGFSENAFEGGGANVIRAAEAGGFIRVDRDAPEYGVGSRGAFVANLFVPFGAGAAGRAAVEEGTVVLWAKTPRIVPPPNTPAPKGPRTAVQESEVAIQAAVKANADAAAAYRLQVQNYTSIVDAQRATMMQAYEALGIVPSSRMVGDIMKNAIERANAIWRETYKTKPPGG